MTTRQFLSILLSCLIFMHPLSLGQWAGTVLVFGSLYYKVCPCAGMSWRACGSFCRVSLATYELLAHVLLVFSSHRAP